MAAKKKAKAKRKAAKKKSSKKVARKKVIRRAAKKKVAAKKRVKAKAKKSTKAPAKVARQPGRAPTPAASAPPAGQSIGVVTHYFTHLGVAIVQLDSGSLREGDTVHIKGHTSDFQQRVESMELDHVHVSEAFAGQSVGLRVRDHAREHDVVYKVT
ncbi:MAG TPA: hypothetical protein VGA88_11740 [Burkholderiales bacterium]